MPTTDSMINTCAPTFIYASVRKNYNSSKIFSNFVNQTKKYKNKNDSKGVRLSTRISPIGVVIVVRAMSSFNQLLLYTVLDKWRQSGAASLTTVMALSLHSLHFLSVSEQWYSGDCTAERTVRL